MNRLYLRNIGLSEEHWPDTVYSKKGVIDDRAEKYKRHQEETGVNPVDTWNLDTVALMWLYERLIEYKKEASKIVDLTYHKFKIDDKEINQEEVLDLLISLAEGVLAIPDELDKESDEYKKLLSNEFVVKKINLDERKESIINPITSKSETGYAGIMILEAECEEKFWKIWSQTYKCMWW